MKLYFRFGISLAVLSSICSANGHARQRFTTCDVHAACDVPIPDSKPIRNSTICNDSNERVQNETTVSQPNVRPQMGSADPNLDDHAMDERISVRSGALIAPEPATVILMLGSGVTFLRRRR